MFAAISSVISVTVFRIFKRYFSIIAITVSALVPAILLLLPFFPLAALLVKIV
jgi:hypothetical protein